MQIDFHHAVTYILARWAGFSHEDASVVAYAAQYVDDAKNNGCLVFETGEMFNRTASAHGIYDIRNLTDRYEDSLSWVPFHFLPGNCEGSGLDPICEDISSRILCVKNSSISKAMVDECIRQKESPYGTLYRLGITMHVYADTWAHEDFAGIKDEINAVETLDAPDEVHNIFQHFIPHMGHGGALTCPDLPFLSWSYVKTNGSGDDRNNPKRFTDAADNMIIAMRRYIAGSPEANVFGLSEAQSALLEKHFTGIDSLDEKTRHREWLDLIRQGEFGFNESVNYDPDGELSWKYMATGLVGEKNTGAERPIYTPNFLKSHWKLFHDALEYHRTFVLNVLLPRYGICAA